MAKEVQVHVHSASPRDSYIEVDGERVEGVESVQVAYAVDGSYTMTVTGKDTGITFYWHHDFGYMEAPA